MSEAINSFLSPEVLLLLLWLIPGAPLLSAILTALLGPRVLRGKSHLPCWSALAVSFVCSVLVLIALPTAPNPNQLDVIAPENLQDASDNASPELVVVGPEWLSVGDLEVGFDLRVDSITAIMLAMVTGVSFL
ncbi:MAG: hypothetical protein ACO3FE_20780, partial [Planctomycetaceae bacterium]